MRGAQQAAAARAKLDHDNDGHQVLKAPFKTQDDLHIGTVNKKYEGEIDEKDLKVDRNGKGKAKEV